MARRPPLTFFLWLLWFSLLSVTRADDKACTGHHGGKYYDLNPLQAGKDYELTTPGGLELVLSACKSVSHETWGLKVQDPGLVGGFIRRAHGDFSMGQTNTTLSFSGRAGHPHLTLASGSKCVDSDGNTLDHLRGSTEIEFICDPSHGAGSPRLVAQLPPGGDELACAWFVEWRTAAACATSEGTTFGGVVWFLFISTLVLLLLYLLLGTLYNHFVLHLSGTDALPRFSLAGALYHVREAWGLARDWWGQRQGGGGYGALPRGPVGLGGPAGNGSRA
ncbi:mannose 6-phosphate receptor domain-containing protein, partial [Mycena maculata]